MCVQTSGVSCSLMISRLFPPIQPSVLNRNFLQLLIYCEWHLSLSFPALSFKLPHLSFTTFTARRSLVYIVVLWTSFSRLWTITWDIFKNCCTSEVDEGDAVLLWKWSRRFLEAQWSKKGWMLWPHRPHRRSNPHFISYVQQSISTYALHRIRVCRWKQRRWDLKGGRELCGWQASGGVW